MNARKSLSLLLCGAITVLTLTGCGGSPASQSSASPSSQSEPASSSESSPASTPASSSSGDGDSIVTNGGEAIALSALEHQKDGASSTVYYTKEITPEAMTAIYAALGKELTGEKIAVKLSTGEPPASNYLEPNLIKDLVQQVNGTIVECNTAYGGQRANTAMHYQVAKDHGFTDIADFVVLDEDGSVSLPVNGGEQLTENLVGAHFPEYDGYLVLSHFKGHAMAGMGGAIKNISIGLGSQEGKCLIHTAGKSHDSPWGGEQDPFTESMAEAGKSVVDSLDGNILFISVMNHLSVDCDCRSHPREPDMHDIGILASTDPVALEQASVDLVFAAPDGETLSRRIEEGGGLRSLEYGEEIGLGSRSYQLISLDETDADTKPHPYLQKLAASIAGELVSPEMSEYEKTKAAFDYIITHVSMGEPIGQQLWRIHGGGDAPIPFIEQRALSPLRFGVGMCEDYAAALTLLLREMGLSAEYVPGLTFSAEGHLVDHAWTMVQIDGVWYHLDSQLEDNISRRGSVRYKYFLRGDATLSGSHRWGQNLVDARLLTGEQNREIEENFLFPAAPRDYPTPERLTIAETPAPNLEALQKEAEAEIAAWEAENGPLPEMNLNTVPPVFGLEGYGPAEEG